MKTYLLHFSRMHRYFVLLGDVAVLWLSLFTSYVIRIIYTTGHLDFKLLHAKFSLWFVLIILPHLLSLFVLDLYNVQRFNYKYRLAILVSMSNAAAALMIGTIFFFFPRYIFGRQVLLIHVVVATVLLINWRFIYAALFVSKDAQVHNKRIALLGNPKNLGSFMDEISKVENTGIEVTAVCFSDQYAGGSDTFTDIPRFNSVASLVHDAEFDILLYDSTGAHFTEEEVRFIMDVKYHEKAIHDLPTFFQDLTGRVPLNLIDGSWLLKNESLQGQLSKPYVHGKRLLDVISAFLLAVFSLPFCFLVAILVKCSGKGPVFFRQERIGLNGKAFTCFKFRTMIMDAERDGPRWTQDVDQRITKIGRFLRKSRLDELPQLYNIIRGDLSFVGPRPIRAFFARDLAKEVSFYGLRFSVQPGLSGWAQVHGCNAVPDGSKTLEYELFYIQNLSFLLDLLIIVKTIRTVLAGKGK